MANKFVLKQSHKGSACSKTKEGDAYDHMGKMVKLNDGKKPHEENLIRQGACGNKKDRESREGLGPICFAIN